MRNAALRTIFMDSALNSMIASTFGFKEAVMTAGATRPANNCTIDFESWITNIVFYYQ